MYPMMICLFGAQLLARTCPQPSFALRRFIELEEAKQRGFDEITSS
jgi:hypothetical protein